MKTLFLGIVILFVISCNKNDDEVIQNPVTVFTPINITPIVLSQGNSNFTPYGNIQYSVYFLNYNDWNQFLITYWPSFINNPQSVINFDIYIPIVAFDAGKSNPGYFVNINSVIEYQNEVVVDLEYTGEGELVQMPTRPYIAFKIPKTNKPIVFQ